jgi:YidC/Oxa1 family membrane protein insertase
MGNNQNFILALVLSFIVLLGWQYFVAGPRIEAERERQAAQEQQLVPPPGAEAPEAAPGQAPQPQLVPQPEPQLQPGVQQVPTPPTQVPEARVEAAQRGERLLVETPSLQGSINLTGARIDDLLLTQYRETVDPDSPNIRLFSPQGSAMPYYAEFGWTAVPGGPSVPTAETVWSAEGGPLRPGEPVVLSWDNGEGLTFRRTIEVDEHYLFTVRQTVENQTGEQVALYPYGLVHRQGLPQLEGFFILHEGLIGYFGNDGLQEVNYSDLGESQPVITPPRVQQGWLGITDKYWAAALIPPAEAAFQGRFIGGQDGATPTYQADFLGDPVVVPAGGSAESQTLLFAGAKETHVIDGYEAAFGIPRFELMIDWGWFYFITKPLFLVIDWLYRLLGNFGVAILAVTVLIKLVFYPLANLSYASMSRMKKLQPEVQKLQERFKDDRMALQQQMMELYKKEKINPLSGCWPILLQIPVFFALYKVLFVTIEMRHAPFFGWIQDLSAPDPTSIFNLFGLIPWSPPLFLQIGIWPIIMGITMMIQMRMNPQPPDKTQAMIFNWMPVFFTFLLATFPAGLVIYWAWNNFLSILQQGLIMRRHGVKIELWDNLKGLFVRSKPGEGPAE